MMKTAYRQPTVSRSVHPNSLRRTAYDASAAIGRIRELSAENAALKLRVAELELAKNGKPLRAMSAKERYEKLESITGKDAAETSSLRKRQSEPLLRRASYAS